MGASAVILAAGRGTRMGGSIPKQFMELCGRPVLYYSVKAYEESAADEIIIVTSDEYKAYVWDSIIGSYGFKKVKTVVLGGAERCDSVYCGVREASREYVLIHDGARPMITPQDIDRCIADVGIYSASVLGVRSKDTVRIADESGIPKQTPDRSLVWLTQTPQAFRRTLLLEAYRLRAEEHDDGVPTDDASLVERMCGIKPHMLEGSYENIKLTTREDMVMAEALLMCRCNCSQK